MGNNSNTDRVLIDASNRLHIHIFIVAHVSHLFRQIQIHIRQCNQRNDQKLLRKPLCIWNNFNIDFLSNVKHIQREIILKFHLETRLGCTPDAIWLIAFNSLCWKDKGYISFRDLNCSTNVLKGNRR